MPLDLAKIFGGGGSGVPIGGVTYMHPGKPHLVTLDSGEVFLRSGFTSKGDEALYPEAYAKMTPYFQGWKAGGSALLSPATTVDFVAEGNGVIVAMPSGQGSGNLSRARYSTDGGITWSNSATMSLGSSYTLQGLFWDSTSSMFIGWAARYDGATTMYYTVVLRSSNGVNWTATSEQYGQFISINRCGSFLIAVGYTNYSPNHYSTIWTSTDAIAWTSRNSTLESSASYAALVGSTYIAVGNNSYTSTDGITWVKRTTFNASSSVAPVVFNGLYLIVSSTPTTVVSTTDAVTYTARLNADVSIRKLCVANGLVFALTTTGVVFVSADGISWRSFNTGIVNANNALWLASKNRWCLVCDTKVLTSADSYTWILQDSPPANAVYGKYSAFVSNLLALVASTGETAFAGADTIGVPQEFYRDGGIAYMRVK